MYGEMRVLYKHWTSREQGLKAQVCLSPLNVPATNCAGSTGWKATAVAQLGASILSAARQGSSALCCRYHTHT